MSVIVLILVVLMGEFFSLIGVTKNTAIPDASNWLAIIGERMKSEILGVTHERFYQTAL